MTYRKRVSEKILKDLLKISGGILITGAKGVGKTETASFLSKTKYFLSDHNEKNNVEELLVLDKSQIFNRYKPILFDEWQDVPQLWDYLRNEIDKNKYKGAFILTGSSTPKNIDKIMHSGIGRINRFVLRTMSLWEQKKSSGRISLESLFYNENKELFYYKNDVNIKNVISDVCEGGWPATLDMNSKEKIDYVYEYYNNLIKYDINYFVSKNLNTNYVSAIMKSYSRNIGSQSSKNVLINDVSENNSIKISESTVFDYLSYLKNLFIIEELESWTSIKIRSKSIIRTSPTKYFVDPSIAVAALNLNEELLLQNLNTLGFLFENLCIRDLRVYAQSIKGEVFKYKDSNGLEIDAAISLRDGKWGLVEIKLSDSEKNIEQAKESLNKVKNNIEVENSIKPSFLMILVGVGNTRKTSDGFYIVNIRDLKK
ncbi:DUF4143 domain-containing protein [Mycoplasma enhydrae]|uniref:ATP-binding protein n=1 Tax=Mycoplasma enhydrae TaxID=2499220 RepID=UPI0021E720AE|nr:DUF4143 domain-containing protein [Mycoplasma enhydrae]MCV3733943.1 DUF4143 domain-containing protein [Mycoplasma enhydrae]